PATDPEKMILACRETSTALLLSEFDESIAELASKHGALLLINVTGVDRDAIANDLIRMAMWPAVAIAVVMEDQSLPADIGKRAPNLILARHCKQLDGSKQPDWVQMLLLSDKCFIESGPPDRPLDLPSMAIESIPAATDFQQARNRCDVLQGKLAPHVDLAGYIVTCDNMDS
ncbi:MAG: hypothetical protein N2C12_08325, partial [Planctomycetales bacterium]